MSSAKRDPVFDATIVAAFRTETKKRTKWFTAERRFLNRVADVMAGKRGPDRAIAVPDSNKDIILEASTKQYWPLVGIICDSTPGLYGGDREFGLCYGIRRSAGSK